MAGYEERRQALLNRNLQWAKPDWKITTFKSDKEEEKFLDWVKQNEVPFDPADPFPDYDMRGFYQALSKGDERASTAVDPYDKQIHFPDYWKTPYHETFSNESQWAIPGAAPTWNQQDQLITQTGQVLFDPYRGY